jgi:hypothetical protein
MILLIERRAAMKVLALVYPGMTLLDLVGPPQAWSAVAGYWAGENMGRVIELIMEYAPQPPYGTGRPDLADAETLAAARVALQHAMSGASE